MALELSDTASTLARCAVTALAYFLTAKLGELLAFPSAPVSALWAPNAIVFAALLLAPTRQWWIYLAAVLLAHCAAQFPVASAEQVLVQYLCNCAEAILGAASLRYLEDEPVRFDDLRAMTNLIVVGALVAPLVTSVAMAGAFVMLDVDQSFWLITLARTITNAFATMLLVPLIVQIVGFAKKPRVPQRVSWRTALESLLLASSLLIIGIAVFVSPATHREHMPVLLYAPLPLLLWATVRFGTIATCSSVLLVGALATWGVLHGHGPFSYRDPVENAVSLVLFMIVTSAPLLLLGSVLGERKVAAVALAANETLHRAVLNSLQSQIAVLDRHGIVLEVNGSWNRAHEKVGLRYAAIKPGQNYLEACSAGADRSDPACIAIRDLLQVVLSGTATRRELEFSVRSAEGTCWFEQTIDSLQRPEGGVVVTLTDVCARKRAEQEVLEQQQQLARLGRLTILGEFAATIAHEIRQPLAAILANAESAALQLKREQLNVPFIVEVVDDIIADDLRARDVIQRLHSMLRNQATQRTPVQLNELASETLLLARGDLTRRGVISNVSLQPDLPSIMGDRVQIQQVVLNLILNACDAMIDLDDNRRRLTLKTRNIPQRNEVELIVCDLGRGIEESKLDRIFQPFVTTKADGLGLGLSISKSIITSHGGRLWVENAFPGAAFHVTLPNSARDSLATHSSSPVNGGRATPRNVSLASAPLARVRH